MSREMRKIVLREYQFEVRSGQTLPIEVELTVAIPFIVL